MRKSKRESICSLFGYEISHGSTVNKDVDRSMVECSLKGQGFLGPSFTKTADLESVLSLGLYLDFVLGVQKEVGLCRALCCHLQGCLWGPEDHSFPDCLGSSSMALMRGWVWLGMGQSQAK
jgi:hypothetical protein